jgi:hypothetical protein
MQQALGKQHTSSIAGTRGIANQLPCHHAVSSLQLQQQQRQRCTALLSQSLRTEVAAPHAKDVVRATAHLCCMMLLLLCLNFVIMHLGSPAYNVVEACSWHLL